MRGVPHFVLILILILSPQGRENGCMRELYLLGVRERRRR